MSDNSSSSDETEEGETSTSVHIVCRTNATNGLNVQCDIQLGPTIHTGQGSIDSTRTNVAAVTPTTIQSAQQSTGQSGPASAGSIRTTSSAPDCPQDSTGFPIIPDVITEDSPGQSGTARSVMIGHTPGWRQMFNLHYHNMQPGQHIVSIQNQLIFAEWKAKYDCE